MDYRNKKALVIGLGVSGKAATRFLMSRGAKVTAVDKNRELLDKDSSFVALHEDELRNLDDFDFVVPSPGIPHTHRLYAAALEKKIPLVGEIELACRAMDRPSVAISGTNGKTTTTLLVEHVLKQSGKKALAVGNVGVPLTQVVDEAPEDAVFVVELSSWQLETLAAKAFDAAAILNITPNHLDRHGTMNDYAAAKLRLASCMKPGAPFYIHSATAKEFPALLQDVGYHLYDRESHCAPPSDAAPHDIENGQAAYLLCRALGVTPAQFAEGWASFKKPSHRIEFVRKIAGVAYYDDSKGTSLDAVAKAVAAMPGPTYLIAGGRHKGASYLPWVEAFAGKVRGILAIGEAASQIAEELGKKIPVMICRDMESAVAFAAAQAKDGEAILLSPGCSSFDMFRDYAHRGEAFRKAVETLCAFAPLR